MRAEENNKTEETEKDEREKDAQSRKRRDGRDTERKGDLAHAFMDGCICIQTSQHALLHHSGQNQPAAGSQPWPFTTSPTGRVCTSCDSE